jgi:hypothetical protein
MNTLPPVPGPSAASPLRLGAASAKQLLQAVRPLIQAEAASFHKQVEADLLHSADGADQALAQRLGASAERFAALFAGQFEVFAREAVDATQRERRGSGAELELIDFSEMEADTVIEAMAARIVNSHAEVCAQVFRKLALLFPEFPQREAHAPLRASSFLRVLVATLQQLGVAQDERLRALRRLETACSALVAATFAQIDRQLVESGMQAVEFLPRPRTMNATTSTTPRAPPAQPPADPAAPAAPTPEAGHAATVAAAASVVGATATLQRLLLQLARSPLAVSPAGAWSPGLHTLINAPTMPAFSLSLDLSAPPGQAAQLQPVVAPLQGAPVDAALLAKMRTIQMQLSAAGVAAGAGATTLTPTPVMVQMRGELAHDARRPIDRLTIEVIGMLFDHIYADQDIAAPIKELLQQLQFPLMQLALTDPQGFTEPDHASRRLINRIASTSVGWSAEIDPERIHLEAVRMAVRTVLLAIHTGSQAFETALEAYERFLVHERQPGDALLQQAEAALTEIERRELLAASATAKIRAALADVQAPPYLHSFLLNVWARVLVAAALRPSGGVERFKRLLSIVPDLVWSVQPKADAQERNRLVQVIPAVLSALREGVLMVAWPAGQQQTFFSELMRSHALAVRASQGLAAPFDAFELTELQTRLAAVSLDALEPAEDVAQPISDTVIRAELNARDIEVDHLVASTEMRMQAARQGPSDREVDAQLRQFRRGDWFELEHGGRVERVRLRFVSACRQLFLFAPAQGKGHSIGPNTLRAYWRAGLLRPSEASPLFDRAVQGVQKRMSAAA